MKASNKKVGVLSPKSGRVSVLRRVPNGDCSLPMGSVLYLRGSIGGGV